MSQVPHDEVVGIPPAAGEPEADPNRAVPTSNGHRHDGGAAAPAAEIPSPETPVVESQPSAAPAETPAPPVDAAASQAELDELRPAEIVRRLDEYIIGQAAAKRAVAVALRNRIRRQRLDDDMRQEVLPKNILMIGPTGVGKTEIARRLARLTHSPFLKVEATKFTEVGYVGRDVESIIRDLLEQTITEVHNHRIDEVEEKAKQLAEERILDSLVAAEERARAITPTPPRETTDDAGAPPQREPVKAEEDDSARRARRLLRRRLGKRLDARRLEDTPVEIEVEEPYSPPVEGFGGTGFEEMGNSLADFFSQLAPPRKRIKRMTVSEARGVLQDDETDRLIDMDRVYDDAIAAVEDSGIVFIDEMDKISGPPSEHGPDISGQGVQRDLLPLLEGSTVHTRYGSVRTDHILFIAAGAFTTAKPSDLIPEMQGRFPIRVELSALTEADLLRILVEPNNALTKQYSALLATEGVTLQFSDEGLRTLANQASAVNDADENIGARRLLTILEKVLEDLSFRAEEFSGQTVVVDAAYVSSRIGDLVRNEDVRRYVL